MSLGRSTTEAKLGRPPVLPSEDESALIRWYDRMNDIGFELEDVVKKYHPALLRRVFDCATLSYFAGERHRRWTECEVEHSTLLLWAKWVSFLGGLYSKYKIHLGQCLQYG